MLIGGSRMTGAAGTQRISAMKKLCDIRSPILLMSDTEERYALLSGDGLYVPPVSFSPDFEGPFRFSAEEDKMACCLVSAGAFEGMPVFDDWGHPADIVDMVLHMCFPDVGYYRLSGCRMYRTKQEVSAYLLWSLVRSKAGMEGRTLPWDKVPTEDLEWICGAIEKCFFPSAGASPRGAAHACTKCLLRGDA